MLTFFLQGDGAPVHLEAALTVLMDEELLKQYRRAKVPYLNWKHWNHLTHYYLATDYS